MKDKLKKVFSIITTVVASLLFVGGTIISIIDLVSPEENSISAFLSEQSYNFLLLIFCAVGLVIVLDKITDGSLKTDVKRILEKINVDRTDVIVLPTQADFYDYFEERIKKLSANSFIYVTTFDKYDANYDHTEGKEMFSDTFMDCWDRYVVKRHVMVKQLVHVTDMHDVEQLTSRLKNNKKSNNFIISVIVGLPIVPYLDWIVIDNRYTLISIVTDASNPYDGGFGFAIDNVEIAKAFITYFEIYSNSKISKVVLNKNGVVEEEHLKEVETSAMLTRPDLEEIGNINKALFKILFDQNVRTCITNIASSLHNIAVCDKTGVLLNNAINIIKKIAFYNQIDITVEESLSALLKIYGSERINIKAVSCADIIPGFWTDDIGKAIQRLCNDESKKNVIERVYIYSKDDSATRKLIKEQKLVTSYTIDKDKFPTAVTDVEDFILVDDKMLLVLKNDSAQISIDKETIKYYTNKFKSLVGYATRR